MPLPNPNCIVFRGLLISDGICELRLMRDDGTHDWSNVSGGGRSSPHAWPETHPDDTLIVGNPNQYFDGAHWGDTAIERSNEDGNMVPLSWDFSMFDSFKAHGTINGAPTGDMDFKAAGTTFLGSFFNDPKARYWVCRLDINADYSFKTNPVYYSGSIDFSNITDEVYYMESPGDFSALTLSEWTFRTTTGLGSTDQHVVAELVTGTNSGKVKSYPIPGFTASDIVDGERKQFHTGFGINGVVGTVDFLKNNLTPTSSFKAIGGDIDRTNLAAYSYPDDVKLFDRVDLGFTDTVKPVNPYGVPFGFCAITRTSIIQKIADISCFTFDPSDVERVCDAYGHSFASPSGSDEWSLTLISGTQLSDFMHLNYNVVFGVNPMQYQFLKVFGGYGGSATSAATDAWAADSERGTVLEHRKIVGATNTSPIIFETDEPHGLKYAGIPVFVLNVGGNTSANIHLQGTKTALIVDDYHFTLADGAGNPINGSGTFTTDGDLYYAGDGFYQWEKQGGYQWSMSNAAVLKDQALRFRCSMLWGYNQSGDDFGKPKLKFKRIGRTTETAPTAMQNAIHVQKPKTFNRNFAKTCVHVKHRGSETGVYCPRKPRTGEDVIELTYVGGTRKWGELSGYKADNFIYDNSVDISEQHDCVYYFKEKADSDGGILYQPSKGWLIGSYDYIKRSPEPSIWPSAFDKAIIGDIGDADNATHTDKAGEYNIVYEEFSGTLKLKDGSTITSGGLTKDSTNIREQNFSDLSSTALIMANALLIDETEKEYTVKSFRNDSGEISGMFEYFKLQGKNRYGSTVYFGVTKLYLNEKTGVTRFRVVEVPSDESVINDLTIISDNGGTSGSVGGSNIGSSTSGGGGSSVGSGKNSLLVNPANNIRNQTAPANGVETDLWMYSLALNKTKINVASATRLDEIGLVDVNGIGYSVIEFYNATNNFDLTGAIDSSYGSSGSNVAPRLVMFRNGTSKVMTIKHHDTHSSAWMRFDLANYHGTAGKVQPGGWAICRYDLETNYWQIISLYPYPADSIDSATGLAGSDVGDGSQMWSIGAGAMPIDRIVNTPTGYVIANLSGSTGPWQATTVASLASALGIPTGVFLLSTSADQVVQYTAKNKTSIFRQRSGDDASAVMIEGQDSSSASLWWLDGAGSLHIMGHIDARILTIDIWAAGYLSGSKITGLDPQGCRNIILTDSSAGVGPYDLCGIANGEDGYELNILDNTGKGIKWSPNDTAEGTTANRIASTVIRIFQNQDFYYDGNASRWRPRNV
ncbi:MAG: hypothetical protein JSS75_07155 [Bacteroidetes bacterium]|nr:hypothetical protein [Bacteroidota bacterium]